MDEITMIEKFITLYVPGDAKTQEGARKSLQLIVDTAKDRAKLAGMREARSLLVP